LKRVQRLLIACALLALTGLATARTLQVPTGYPTIQTAITAADPGDKIMVAPGTYTEDINLLGKAIHLRSRSRRPKHTTIQGTGNGAVVTCTRGETSATILEGFTITGGAANPDSSWGGGMHVENSSPTVKNCVFRSNVPYGMCNRYSSSTVAHCRFKDDEIFNWSSSLTVTGCVFTGNVSDGIILSVSSDAIVTRCKFIRRSAGISSGYGELTATGCTFRKCDTGIDGSGHIDHTVSDCTFRDNAIGMVSNHGTVRVSDCSFIGNDVAGMTSSDTFNESAVCRCIFTGNAIGMAYRDQNERVNGLYVTDCLFTHNGNGMEYYGFPEYPETNLVTNCTFSRNDVAAVHNDQSLLVLTNCILWSNADGSIVGTPAAVTYSDVEGGYVGEGNIDADPLFVNPDARDFHLAPGSPCIDAGTNNPSGEASSKDIEGNSRPVDGDHDEVAIADMGAFEAAGRQ
jgi:hypothetical protein